MNGSTTSSRVLLQLSSAHCIAISWFCGADLATGNPAQWSFHALRAHPDLRGTHLSCRATWVLLDQGPSWRQGSRAQPVNQAQNLSEQSFGDSDLGELECDIAAVAHDPGADLHLLLSQCLLRLVFDLLRQYRLLLMATPGSSEAVAVTVSMGSKAEVRLDFNHCPQAERGGVNKATIERRIILFLRHIV